MNYIDKVNIKGFEYEIHDTTVRNNVSELSSEINELKDTNHLLESYANDISPIITVNPNNRISITDAAPLIPEELKVNMEPIQDLHDYNNAWPEGGGKNLLSPFKLHGEFFYQNGWIMGKTENWRAVQTGGSTGLIFPFTYTTSGEQAYTNVPVFVTKCLPNTTYTITPPEGLKAVVSEYRNSNTYIASAIITSWQTASNNVTGPITKTTTANTNYLVIGFTNLNGTSDITVDASSRMQLEKGSSSTAYSPYSNVCPITGHTGIKIIRSGKNLLNKDTVTTGYSLTSNGELYEDAEYVVSDFIPVKPSTYYARNIERGENSSICFYDSDKNYISRVNSSNTNAILTAAKTAYIRAAFLAMDLDTAQIELGPVMTSYESYNGDVFSFTFPSSNSTIYGGTIDLIKGELIIDMASIDLSLLTWQSDPNRANVFYSPSIDNYAYRSWPWPKAECSAYKYIGVISDTTNVDYNDFFIAFNYQSGIDNDYKLYLKDSRISNVSYMEEYLQGVQLVYELNTPIIRNLTPQEIRMFKNYNNILADNGNITLSYRQNSLNKINELENLINSLIYDRQKQTSEHGLLITNQPMDNTITGAAEIKVIGEENELTFTWVKMDGFGESNLTDEWVEDLTDIYKGVQGTRIINNSTEGNKYACYVGRKDLTIDPVKSRVVTLRKSE